MTFAGPLSRTADLAKMTGAAAMASSGHTADDIWNETGWFKDLDGAWKYEIPDDKLALRGAKAIVEAPRYYHPVTGNIIVGDPGAYDFSSYIHAELKKAYNMREEIAGRYGRDVMNAGGLYHAPCGIRTGNGGRIVARGKSPECVKGTLVHELDHALQNREGFANGGNPKMFTAEEVQAEQERQFYEWLRDVKAKGYVPQDWNPSLGDPHTGTVSEGKIREDMCRRLKGEVSARNADKRRLYGPVDRQKLPPWHTEDVDPQDQMIRFHDGAESYVHPEFTGCGDPNPFFRLDPSIDPPKIDPRVRGGYYGPPRPGFINP